MPELPEVETIARRLEPHLRGEIIDEAQVFWPRTLAFPDLDAFKKRIRGQEIQRLSRRGKFLLLHLSTDTLLIHLRMSGDLLLKEGKIQPEKHDRLILTLTALHPPQTTALVFTDARKFGRVWLTAEPQQILGRLGPEPFDAMFTAAWLSTALASKQRQIKPLLLDQTFIAGLGNIYADEALHLAGIHPLTPAHHIPARRVAALWSAIRSVLEEGIRRNGASIDWVYRGGEFQNHFRVYGRTGEACLTCGTPIQRILIGQRSSHFCPFCQPRE
ncbi:MAG: bifunctional DNA-formamidopyrimidine glycosylase/DNA-(apurinic or apyrimidinic site) lyase [Anaerolineae bacterium]